MTADRRATAAVVVIGNEVLSGKVADANASYLIRRLRESGIRLRHVAIVPDELDEIGEAVRRAAGLYDHVFTTGGVGPTHDDITVEAIARAFDVPVEENAALLALVQRHLGEGQEDAHRRLARAPRGSRLVGQPSPPWPTLAFRNVYILPGIPELMRSKFERIAETFDRQAVYVAAVEARAREAEICRALDELVEGHPRVEIGSYPTSGAGSWAVRVTLESVSEQAVAEALEAVRASLGERVVSVEATRPVEPSG